MNHKMLTRFLLTIFAACIATFAQAEPSDFQKCNKECSNEFRSDIHDCKSHENKCFKEARKDHKECVADCRS